MSCTKNGNASPRTRECKRINVRELARRAKRRAYQKVEAVRRHVAEQGGLPFANLVAMERIVTALEDLGYAYRSRVYPPWVTLWAFLSQVTSPDSSCAAAVMRVIAYRIVTGQGRCSASPSSYSAARQRLPEAFYARLACDLGEELDALSPSPWLWLERHVKIVDGTTLTMPDTEANQAVYPQSSNQKAGLGFPIARLTALFSLSVGTIVDAEITGTRGKKTGEITAFRTLWRSLRAGDVVLGDCLYDGYSDIAQLHQRQVDVVFGMSQSRARDFRRGTTLGPGDHLVEWSRPRFDKSRLDRETWDALPPTMLMRELTRTITDARGKRHTITLVTTLLDAAKYPADEIFKLFRGRWNCELDLRSVKTLMGMAHLSCESPEMIRKEIWTYLLAYNLLRWHMARAADTYAVEPRKLSFNNARQAMQTFTLSVLGASAPQAEQLYEETLHVIASHRVGKRPGRVEPRKVKRRKSKYPYLTAPRSSPKSLAA